MNRYGFQFIFLPAAGLSSPEASEWKRQIQDGTRESQELLYQRKQEEIKGLKTEKEAFRPNLPHFPGADP